MDDQVEYVGYVADGMKHTPSEYMTSGRFFCSIVSHEGPDMVETVNRILGDHILMFGRTTHTPSRISPGPSIRSSVGTACPKTPWRASVGQSARAFGEP